VAGWATEGQRRTLARSPAVNLGSTIRVWGKLSTPRSARPRPNVRASRRLSNWQLGSRNASRIAARRSRPSSARTTALVDRCQRVDRGRVSPPPRFDRRGHHGRADRRVGEAPNAPELIEHEALNALRRLERVGAISSAQADRAVSEFNQPRLICHPHAALRGRVWALRDNLTAYDALYWRSPRRCLDRSCSRATQALPPTPLARSATDAFDISHKTAAASRAPPARQPARVCFEARNDQSESNAEMATPATKWKRRSAFEESDLLGRKERLA